MAKVVPDMFAVFAADPGGTSAIAMAYGKLLKTVPETLLECDILALEFKGGYVSQGREIIDVYQDFVATANIGGVPLDRIEFVCESFALRQRHADLAPVEVRSAMETYASVACPTLIPALILQTPSDAMTYCTNERLRRWKVWIKGSEHKRDATRHLALRISRLLEGV